MKTINILGTKYKIIISNEKKNKKLIDANGLCEQYAKQIILDDFSHAEKDIMIVDNLQGFKDKVLRHEIIHAFIGESGLRNNTGWAENEEMVDWFAIQYPKIKKVFELLHIEE